MTALSGKHLVIFGCGYAGGALADAALAAGARVTALTRNPEKAERLRERGIAVVTADLADSTWHHAVREVDFVANTVAAASPGAEGYRHSYIEGMRSVMAWAGSLPRPVHSFVYTSSTGVYPQGGGASVDETASVAEASPRGRLLLEAEAVLRSAPSAAVARWFILRLAGIYGPSRHALLEAMRAGTTQFPGGAQFHLNVAHRDDIVAAILACFQAPAGVANEIFNVADNSPATRETVVRWLGTQLGHSGPWEFAGQPRRDGEPASDRVILNGKLRRVLGWNPRHPDFRSGYAALLREV